MKNNVIVYFYAVQCLGLRLMQTQQFVTSIPASDEYNKHCNTLHEFVLSQLLCRLHTASQKYMQCKS